MKRLWIIGLICLVFAVGVGVFLWKGRIAEPQGIDADGAHAAVSEEPRSANESMEEPHPSPASESIEIGERVIARQRTAKRMNAPVKFYVRVVDQNSAPVSDAVLTGTVSSYNEGLWVKDVDAVRTSKFEVRSDAAGRIEIANLRGWSLRLEDLKKEGYSWQHPGFGSFGVGGDTPTRIPSYSTPAQPLVLHMWKKGPTEPVVRQGVKIRLRAEQEVYGVNLLTGQKVLTNELPDLIIRFALVSDTSAAARAHRLVSFEVPNGGILEAKDAYPYAAPATGYQPTWQWVYLAADAPPGKENWKRNFYIRGRGGRVYAGLAVKFDSMPAIEIDAVINPAGSPMLEPDPGKLITDPDGIRRLDESTRGK